MNRIALWLAGYIFLLSACTTTPENTNIDGLWRAEISMQNQKTPFLIEFKTDESGNLTAVIRNGEERIPLDDIEKNGDSLHIPLHVFDASLDLAIENNAISGTYTKHYLDDYVLPISFHQNDERFVLTESPEKPANFEGKWSVQFVYPEENDTTKAVGVFKQDGNTVSGTFLTKTGDYRYLAGVAEGNNMKISAFDGNHAFLFTANMTDSGTLSGDFWSGKNWHETWTATRNESASLPDADSLTFLKPGYEELSFQFPNLNGDTVSLDDPKYDNKVVLVQIFGTWCPNCMDETNFLAEWYRNNKDRGVEIIGLAYEQKDDFEYATKRVQRMKQKWDVNYDFLIAGTSDKQAAAKTLPMLNHVLSFPTTIFIDKKGDVAKIHTGFSGPGTGEYYDAFVKDFNETMDKLISE